MFDPTSFCLFRQSQSRVDNLVVKGFSNHFDVRQGLRGPANDFVSRAQKCNVFVGIGFLSVFPGMAGIVQFYHGHYREVLEANQIVELFLLILLNHVCQFGPFRIPTI